MIARTALPALAILVSTARAGTRLGEPPSVMTSGSRSLPVQIAINFPGMWDLGSVGGSVYAGVTEHVALRFNVATWHPMSLGLGDTLSIASGDDDGSDAKRTGRIIDTGVGAVFYPRALWDGLTLEVGALRRARDTTVENIDASPDTVTTRTSAYSARVLVGWSWLIHRRFVLSWAVGGSAGYESGTETSHDRFDPMPATTRDVGRSTTSREAYLRFGGAFDL